MKVFRLRPWVATCGLSLVIAAGVIPVPASAADAYPARAVRMIIPFAAGGGADAVARLLGNGLSERLGQPVGGLVWRVWQIPRASLAGLPGLPQGLPVARLRLSLRSRPGGRRRISISSLSGALRPGWGRVAPPLGARSAPDLVDLVPDGRHGPGFCGF